MHPQPNKQDYIKHVQKAGHAFGIAQMEKKTNLDIHSIFSTRKQIDKKVRTHRTWYSSTLKQVDIIWYQRNCSWTSPSPHHPGAVSNVKHLLASLLRSARSNRRRWGVCQCERSKASDVFVSRNLRTLRPFMVGIWNYASHPPFAGLLLEWVIMILYRSKKYNHSTACTAGHNHHGSYRSLHCTLVDVFSHPYTGQNMLMVFLCGW